MVHSRVVTTASVTGPMTLSSSSVVRGRLGTLTTSPKLLDRNVGTLIARG